MVNNTILNSVLGVAQPLFRQIDHIRELTNVADTRRKNITCQFLSSAVDAILTSSGVTTKLVAIVLGVVGLPILGKAQSATVGPPIGFPDTANLALNPSFEQRGSNGPYTVYQKPWPASAPSAAANWEVHSSNAQARVTTLQEATTVPAGTDPAGKPEGQKQMLHIIAEGNEGGVYQLLNRPPSHLMFSVWVYVKRGQVVIQSNGGTTGPAAWSTKHGQWEELRVCTDGSVPVNSLVIYNQDPKGGDFCIDRVEARATSLP
jgi:hypothetical protein